MLARGRRTSEMRGQSLHDWADQYLTQGRLHIIVVDPHRVEARCQGRQGVYRLGFEPGRGWWCECPRDPCPHVMALMKVTRPIHPKAEESPHLGFAQNGR